MPLKDRLLALQELLQMSLRCRPNSAPWAWRYNTTVPPTERESGPRDKHQRHAAYATETAGLLLIAFLLLVLTILRYWHAIHWSLR